MIRLLFIRHGATAGNLEKRYIGRTDEPLCAEGITQVQKLKNQGLQADRVYVSPMLRTRQTAEILFPDTAYTVVDDLRETDFGIFEGKTAAELSDDPAYQEWVDGLCQGPIPSGEGMDICKVRQTAAFSQALTTIPDGKTAAFVIHGGTIMAILEQFAVPQKSFYDFHIGNGCCICAEYRNGVLCVKGNFRGDL